MKFRSSGKDYSKKELFEKACLVGGFAAGGLFGVFELAPLAIETGMATSTMGGAVAQTVESLTVLFGITSAVVGCEIGNVTQKVVNKLSSRISGKNEDVGFSAEEKAVPLEIERVSSFSPGNVGNDFGFAVSGSGSKAEVLQQQNFQNNKGLKPS